jgi:hypothetical protein
MMKMNKIISLALMALLTLGAGTAMAASTDTTEMMKKEGMEKMDEMKKSGMEEMDGEMKKEGMKKVDEMKKGGMEKMDGEMKKDHKKAATMDS